VPHAAQASGDAEPRLAVMDLPRKNMNQSTECAEHFGVYRRMTRMAVARVQSLANESEV
jgi:hypothetical protein